MYRIVQTYFQRTLNFTLCVVYRDAFTIFSSQIDVSQNEAEQG